ncbi:MAG: hypothetical protein Kow0099_21580 [Candidatus Abyssubacteria bacterium]
MRRTLFGIAVCVLLATGCVGERQVHEQRELGSISGTVEIAKPADAPIYLGINTDLDEMWSGAVDAFTVMPEAGPYRFKNVPAGNYWMAAFVDLNRDTRPDLLAEPYFVSTSPITVSPDTTSRYDVKGFFNERDPHFKTAERVDEYRILHDRAQAAVEAADRMRLAKGGAVLRDVMPTLGVMLREAETKWAVAGNPADWEHITALLTPLEALATAAMEGRDLTVTLRGCMLRGYISEVDASLQPYALYVPVEYDGTRPFPLVIALHPAGVDHWSGLRLVTGHSNLVVGPEKANRQFFPRDLPPDFIIACPNGHGFEGPGYRGPAEYDVLRVIEEVRKHYHIKTDSVFLTGASKGGQGTWEIGLKHPHLFSAIAPVCGATGLARQFAEGALHVKVYAYHGVKDRITSVNESRAMAAAVYQLGVPVNYVYTENSEWNHFGSWRVYDNGAIFDVFRG